MTARAAVLAVALLGAAVIGAPVAAADTSAVVTTAAGQTFWSGPRPTALAPITLRESAADQFSDGTYQLLFLNGEATLQNPDPPGTAFDAHVTASSGHATVSGPVTTSQYAGAGLLTFTLSGTDPRGTDAVTISGLRMSAQGSTAVLIRLHEVGSRSTCAVGSEDPFCGITADHTIDPQDPLDRISGWDRYSTAAVATAGGNLQATLVAGDGSGVDALSAVHLAHVTATAADLDAMRTHPATFTQTAAGPVLLTTRDVVPDATLLRLRDTGFSTTDAAANAGRTVWIVGGQGVVSASVERQVQGAFPGVVVRRVFGADRYATAAATALQDAATVPPGTTDSPDLVTQRPTAVLASGTAIADALSAAPFTGEYPLLLTQPSQLPAATRDALTRLHITRVVLVGGPDAIQPAVVDQLTVMGIDVHRVSGADRYATEVALLTLAGNQDPTFPGGLHLSFSTSRADLVSGTAVTDALTRAEAASTTHPMQPVVLIDPHTLSPSTAAWLHAHHEWGTAVGGLDALPQPVVDAARAAATG